MSEHMAAEMHRVLSALFPQMMTTRRAHEPPPEPISDDCALCEDGVRHWIEGESKEQWDFCNCPRGLERIAMWRATK